MLVLTLLKGVASTQGYGGFDATPSDGLPTPLRQVSDTACDSLATSFRRDGQSVALGPFLYPA